MLIVLLTAAGGALGALGRFGMSFLLASKFGTAFPYGTLAVNALGGFIILFFMTFFIDRLSIDPVWRIFVVTGFLGGFTTFSSFTYETVMMIQDREYLKALLNFSLNNILAFAFALAGFLTAKNI